MTKGQSIMVRFQCSAHTIRFAECTDNWKPLEPDDGCAVGALYVQKQALGDKVPERIEVTITAR